MQSLSEMAHILGLRSDAEMWQRKAHSLAKRMVEHFWDERAGLFQFQCEHTPIPVKTPFNLLPLWTGELPPAMTTRLVGANPGA